ncbi:uncharacterized protein TNCV_4989211 [Trichonephila clavipes]|nr:uncharacterized protein TNCV_4989211 [Trichonephila clavipes]
MSSSFVPYAEEANARKNVEVKMFSCWCSVEVRKGRPKTSPDPIFGCMSTNRTRMLSGKDKALLVKQSKRPSLRQICLARVAAEMETLASKSAARTSSAREAGRCLGLPLSSICNILHGILNQYPYKLQSFHELLPLHTVQREVFVCKNSKKQRNVSPEQEDERGPMPTSASKDLLKKWEVVRAMDLEWHPYQADVSRFGDLYNNNAINYFWKKIEKQSTLDIFFNAP